MTKYTKYIVSVGLLLTLLACKSVVGTRYTFFSENESLSLIPTSDSSAVLYFANSMPMAQWNYHTFLRKGRRYRAAIIYEIDTLDHNLLEYCERKYSESSNENIACIGDTVFIHPLIFFVTDKKGEIRTHFYYLRRWQRELRRRNVSMPCFLPRLVAKQRAENQDNKPSDQ